MKWIVIIINSISTDSHNMAMKYHSQRKFSKLIPEPKSKPSNILNKFYKSWKYKNRCKRVDTVFLWLVTMMSLHMIQSTMCRYKLCITYSTCIWFIAGMNTRMCCKAATLSKCLATLFAFPWFVYRVCTHMSHHITPVVKPSTTRSAFKRLFTRMDHKMPREIFRRFKLFITFDTRIWSFSSMNTKVFG